MSVMPTVIVAHHTEVVHATLVDAAIHMVTHPRHRVNHPVTMPPLRMGSYPIGLLKASGVACGVLDSIVLPGRVWREACGLHSPTYAEMKTLARVFLQVDAESLAQVLAAWAVVGYANGILTNSEDVEPHLRGRPTVDRCGEDWDLLRRLQGHRTAAGCYTTAASSVGFQPSRILVGAAV